MLSVQIALGHKKTQQKLQSFSLYGARPERVKRVQEVFDDARRDSEVSGVLFALRGFVHGCAYAMKGRDARKRPSYGFHPSVERAYYFRRALESLWDIKKALQKLQSFSLYGAPGGLFALCAHRTGSTRPSNVPNIFVGRSNRFGA